MDNQSITHTRWNYTYHIRVIPQYRRTVMYGETKEDLVEIIKKLCDHIVAKVYLMRRRSEEYFKFKKQQFELENLRVMFLKFICNLNLLATLAAGYIGLASSARNESIYLK